MEKKQEYNYTRLQIYIPPTDDKGMLANSILQKVGKKSKKSELLGVMTDCFMEAFSLDSDVSQENLLKIIENYDFIKPYLFNYVEAVKKMDSVIEIDSIINIKKEQEDKQKVDASKMNEALSFFGL